ncbi:MAG: type II toxin-antitoxin system HicB family antitoxin [Vitreoscilla sp.]|nr:type II toxin-antitoxin system HicB family antitoxin [Polaromonas sp.]
MHNPIAIETGTDTQAYGVAMPDLPGCFSAGDTLDQAMTNAKEAIVLWLEVAIDDGMAVPEPKTLAAHQGKRAFREVRNLTISSHGLGGRWRDRDHRGHIRRLVSRHVCRQV